MRTTLRHRLFLVASLASAMPANILYAQSVEEQLVEVMRTAPGVERSKVMATLADQELRSGHATSGLELAIMSTQEAERSGSPTAVVEALLTLASAHRAKGNDEQAVAAGERAALIGATSSPHLHGKAQLVMAEHYQALGLSPRSLELINGIEAPERLAPLERTRLAQLIAQAPGEGIDEQAYTSLVKKEIAEARDRNDRGAMLALMARLAGMRLVKGDVIDAAALEQECLQLATDMGRTREAAIAANNLGAIHHREQRHAAALESFANAEVLAKGDAELLARIRMNKALAMVDSGDRDGALGMVKKEEDRAEALSATTRLLIHRTAAALQLRSGEPRAAQVSATQALRSAEARSDLQGQMEACQLLAQVLETREMPVDAKNHERRARDLELQLADQVKRAEVEKKALLMRLNRAEREQAEIFNRDRQQAMEMERMALDGSNRENLLALALKEKELEEGAKREAMLAGERAQQALQLAEALLAKERQDRTIRELDADRMIQTLNLSKARSESQEQQRALEVAEQRSAMAEAEKEHERLVKRLSMGLALLAVLGTIWLAIAWINTRRKKRTIQEQHAQISRINEELAEKNSDIQSSLAYARTIQSAILPGEADLARSVPDSFMLYRPLDVVSGDLPFVRRIGDRSFIAAIDCTGHGVPAAMMTFIAYYGLMEIIGSHPDATPGRILDLLHAHVRGTMEGRGQQAVYDDGLDIGLCVLDHGTGTLFFAGAQLPLIIAREGKAERVRGDVLPLGDRHYAREVGYRTHVEELRAGDGLYLLSDGIIHQMSGADPKNKLSLKRLITVLESSDALTMTEVKQKAEELLAEWKGHSPQTDDILLIGMRYAA